MKNGKNQSRHFKMAEKFDKPLLLLLFSRFAVS
nr:MAG TPA: hypothetical protein [Caudoviricetes sp.]